MLLFLLAQGEAPAPPASPPAGDGGWLTMLGAWWPMIAIIVIMYVMLLRPQRQKEKRRQSMLKDVKRNDHVVTIGGIHGVVKNITDTDVVLLVDEKHDLTMKFNRSAVYTILGGDEEGELPRKD